MLLHAMASSLFYDHTIILFQLSLFRNQKPATAPYRASSMNLFFRVVLTVAFFVAIVAVGITIGV